MVSDTLVGLGAILGFIIILVKSGDILAYMMKEDTGTIQDEQEIHEEPVEIP